MTKGHKILLLQHYSILLDRTFLICSCLHLISTTNLHWTRRCSFVVTDCYNWLMRMQTVWGFYQHILVVFVLTMVYFFISSFVLLSPAKPLCILACKWNVFVVVYVFNNCTSCKLHFHSFTGCIKWLFNWFIIW